MKRISILVSVLAILIAGSPSMCAQDALESELAARLERASSLTYDVVKPNEIVKGDVTYSGIGVALLKTDNLRHLLSPFAPAKHSSGEDNILRDPGTGRVYGWKLFSIRF